MNIYAQIIGLSAIVIWVLSINKTNKKELVFLQIISNALYGIQYTILGGISAACMNYLSTLRCAIYYKDIKNNKKTSKNIVLLFIALMIIIGVISYNGIISIIPTFITCIYAYSLWQPNMKVLYYIIIFVALLWILYNSYVGAYISVIGNVFEIICAIKSIRRLK